MGGQPGEKAGGWGREVIGMDRESQWSEEVYQLQEQTDKKNSEGSRGGKFNGGTVCRDGRSKQ